MSNLVEQQQTHPAALSHHFQNLFRQFYQPLVFFARRLVQDEPVAEDIVTDLFLKLWEKLEDFDTIQSVKAFLYISTRNACLNYIQQAQYQARAKNSLRYLMDDSDDCVLNDITRTEVLREIAGLIESLPPQCRKVILLSYSTGLDNREIARRLQVSIHTVRNQKVRGVELMKRRSEVSMVNGE